VLRHSKAELRTRLLAARKAVPPEVRAAEATQLTTHLNSQVSAGDTVCAYVPVGSEPGSIAMLDALVHMGVRLLLPLAVAGEPLLWSGYQPGQLARAGYGLLEPIGPRLPAVTLRDARVVIVPALAVDVRGTRLGRGAGFYDRSLPLRDPSARLIAVVRDDELVDELPADLHDIPMTHAATPGGGVTVLNSSA